jgi:hypothetical protein
MGLPDSYTLKPNAIPDYFDAIQNAQAPDRFSTRFLEGLGFKSTNDRLVIGVLKDLGFIDSDGKPTDRYFRFLDRAQSARVLAEGIREAYAQLFEVRTNAQDLGAEDVKNKLRTLYAGKKTDLTIGRIANTFAALCQIADFSQPPRPDVAVARVPIKEAEPVPESVIEKMLPERVVEKTVGFRSLQYHINIVLPESRDQAVYDALFKALKDHLG